MTNNILHRRKISGRRKGIVLVEALIYSFLLSFILTTLLSYAYHLRESTMRLLDKIEYRQEHGGFSATIAVMMLSLGTLPFALLSSYSAQVYADSVYRRELRIQAGLNAVSCIEIGKLLYAKDKYFLERNAGRSVEISDLNCTLQIISEPLGGYILKAGSTLAGVSEYATENLIVE